MKFFLFLLSVGFCAAVSAQQLPLCKEADLAAGEKMVAENKSNECHRRRVGGDGSRIYQPAGRINTAGALRGMVEYCNTELNLGFFPEDTTAVAAVLNKQHYKFR